MSSKYSEEQKNEAIEMLRIGDHVGLVHYTTGIPERTLRHWRQKLREAQDCQIAEKSFDPAIAARQNTDSDAPSPLQQREPADTNSPDDEDELSDADRDYEDFTYIREKLMKCARAMADELESNHPDSNRRSLALARILDRIQWLDEFLPDRIPERVIRFEYSSNGVQLPAPPWAMDSDDPQATMRRVILGDPDKRAPHESE